MQIMNAQNLTNAYFQSLEEKWGWGGGWEIKMHAYSLLHSVSFSLVFMAAIISQ